MPPLPRALAVAFTFSATGSGRRASTTGSGLRPRTGRRLKSRSPARSIVGSTIPPADDRLTSRQSSLLGPAVGWRERCSAATFCLAHGDETGEPNYKRVLRPGGEILYCESRRFRLLELARSRKRTSRRSWHCSQVEGLATRVDEGRSPPSGGAENRTVHEDARAAVLEEMRLQLTDAFYTERLLTFLQSVGQRPTVTGPGRIEVAGDESEVKRLEVELYVRVWQVIHPEAEVDFVSDAADAVTT